MINLIIRKLTNKVLSTDKSIKIVELLKIVNLIYLI